MWKLSILFDPLAVMSRESRIRVISLLRNSNQDTNLMNDFMMISNYRYEHMPHESCSACTSRIVLIGLYLYRYIYFVAPEDVECEFEKVERMSDVMPRMKAGQMPDMFFLFARYPRENGEKIMAIKCQCATLA